MADTQETIADIIAEMCGGPIPQHRHDRVLLRHFADRLEAAWKREKAEAEANALAVGGVVEASRATAENSSAVGNCAKLREALIEIRDLCVRVGKDISPLTKRYKSQECQAVNRCFRIAVDALAKPPRNCDVGTAEEQLKRFKDFCRIISKDETCDGCPLLPQCSTLEHCSLKWAQTLYKEGEIR